MKHAEFPMYRFVDLHPGPCASMELVSNLRTCYSVYFLGLMKFSRVVAIKKFSNVSGSSKNSLDRGCSHGRVSKQAA